MIGSWRCEYVRGTHTTPSRLVSVTKIDFVLEIAFSGEAVMKIRDLVIGSSGLSVWFSIFENFSHISALPFSSNLEDDFS